MPGRWLLKQRGRSELHLLQSREFVVEYLAPEARPVADTLADPGREGAIGDYVERSVGWAADTPVVFVSRHLLELLRQFREIAFVADYPDEERVFGVLDLDAPD